MAAQVDKAKFVELLEALSNPDNATRHKAETLYQQAKQTEPDSLLVGLLTVLSAAEVKDTVRRKGGVLLRQLVTAGHEKDFVYGRIPLQHQQQLAAELLRAFEQETKPKVKTNMGDVISKLAEYVCNKEDPRGSLAPGSPIGWPALLPSLFNLANVAAAGAQPAGCEAAIRLLLDLLPTMKDDIAAAKQELGLVLQAALEHGNLKLRTVAVLLVCGIAAQADKAAWTPLLSTFPVVMQVLQQLVQASEEDLLQEVLQALTDVATAQPDFFKPQMLQGMEPATFMATVARSRDNVPNGVRTLALDWLVTFMENRKVWLNKHLRHYPPLVLEACMNFLLEADAGEEELQAWVARMDDEEGDEDEDEVMHAGEQALDRLAAVMELEDLGPSLFKLIGHFLAQDSWQAKHAALLAMKQTAEYLEEKNQIDEMARLLLQHVDHPHPRVRFMALYGLGQLANDQSPTLQEGWHQAVIPVVLRMMDDPVDRVAAMSMSLFVSFGEELDTTLMNQYSLAMMEKVGSKLQGTQHRGVREESITCIAVIAGNIGKEFSKYYDSMMPLLKQYVLHATGEKASRLRGKSFECMSLLGLAVGKEKFLPDAREAITEMFGKPIDDDDLQREYIKEAADRICQCLKQDFAPFMPNLLPGLLRTLRFDQVAETGDQQEHDDMYVKVTTGEGQLVRVHCNKFEEMKTILQLLLTFCHEMGSAFFDYVQPCAEALMPVLSNSDEEFTTWCAEVRGTALQAWAMLIKVARQGADRAGATPELAQQLLSTGVGATFGLLGATKDAETLCAVASGIAECVRNAGSNIILAAEAAQIVDKMFDTVDRSLNRTAKMQHGQKHEPEDEDEDDDKDWDEHEEEQLRRNCEEVLGALFEVSAAHCEAVLPRCGEKIAGWLNSKQNRVLGLYLSCDILLHMKEKSLPIWPTFMDQVFVSLRTWDKEDADARLAAAFAVQIAARCAAFQQAAPEAYRLLAKVVSGARPKKRDTSGRKALDNAVCALLSLAQEQPQSCPSDIQAWPLIVARIPLRDDETEAQKTHDKLVDLVIAQDQALLGGQGSPNVGALLSAFAEVYGMKNLSKDETDAKIKQVFTHLPRDVLQGCAACFSEKQQKKIERMLLG